MFSQMGWVKPLLGRVRMILIDLRIEKDIATLRRSVDVGCALACVLCCGW